RRLEDRPLPDHADPLPDSTDATAPVSRRRTLTLVLLGAILLAVGAFLAQKHIASRRTESRPSYVVSVAFSPDGSRIASCRTDGTVRVWDVQTGQQTLSFR